MSEYRFNAWMHEWVIVAPQRGARPNDVVAKAYRRSRDAYVADCPFCPGNEAATPPAIAAQRAGDASEGWALRIVPNKYPAVRPGTSEGGNTSPTSADETLFALRPGIGAHELIVETPRHDGFPATWSAADARRVARAYRDRYRALIARPEVRYVLVFKNHGERGGTSLEHPHSQVVATSVIPETVRQRREIARAHHQRSGRCLVCDLVDAELAADRRIVARDDRFVVFHPFAASRAAETWIVPLAHSASFGAVDDPALGAFAEALRDALRRLHVAFGDPDFNSVLHSGPEEETAADHWLLRIVPHLGRAAGFELGSGVHINTELPEETAERMRSATV